MKKCPFILEKGIEFITVKTNPELSKKEIEDVIKKIKEDIEKAVFCNTYFYY